MEITIKEGDYRKFGVTKIGKDYMFTFAGEKEKECYICLYGTDCQLIARALAPQEYCMGSVRSVLLSGIKTKELRYHYEIDGKRVFDPYADKVLGREKWNDRERATEDYAVFCGKNQASFEWEGDTFPEVQKQDMVLYKLHVRGFSMDGITSGKKRGTFLGLLEQLPYIKELGVTTIECMPLYEFEELILEEKQEIPEYIQKKDEEGTQKKVVGLNYWGYGVGDYFAVKASYASNANASTEFKTLVKQMHKMGLECVMELYFPSNWNQNMMLDVLRFWVREYHVDGFHLVGEGIPITAICQDVFLSRTKIFYDFFEGAIYEQERNYKNLYVYNEDYLYASRKLLNHMGGSLEEYANQQKRQHQNLGFVNYITNHNGFTLMDLFSYQEKHNEENGEGNTDGNPFNFSSNCGMEGKTTKRYINDLRKKQMMNAFAMLFFSQGVPLILAGDERGNSQNGNNNAYCQDNRIGWINWKKDAKNEWLVEFVRQLSALRRKYPMLRKAEPMRFNDYKHTGYPDVSYHGESAWISSFCQVHASYGMMYCDVDTDFVYVGYNFFAGMAHLALPKLPKGKKWHLIMDTSRLEEPFLKEMESVKDSQLFQMKAQSIVVLIGK